MESLDNKAIFAFLCLDYQNLQMSNDNYRIYFLLGAVPGRITNHLIKPGFYELKQATTFWTMIIL